jgi:hypothetical protein
LAESKRGAGGATRDPAGSSSRTAPTGEAPGPVADWVRRFTALGLSGFFSTEGAIRKAFGDTVPQDWIDFLTEQSDRGRQELFDRLAGEVGRVIENMDPEDVLDRLLTGRSIEIEAKVRIGPRQGEGDAGAPGTSFEIRKKSG